MRGKSIGYMLATAAAIQLMAGPLAAQAAPGGSGKERTYIYDFDELAAADSRLPGGLRLLRANDGLFAPCRSAGDPHAAAVVVPLVLGLFKIFANVADAHLKGQEKKRLEAMSRSYAQLRTEAAFPLAGTGPGLKCLVVDRNTVTDGTYKAGALYVLGLRRVGTTGFTIEPLGARIDSSPILAAPTSRTLDATVSVTFQSIMTVDRNNQLATFPAYSVAFKKLELTKPGTPPETRSPVLPLAASLTVPTSIAAAVTESDSRLEKEKERVALEQANRALLTSALGDILKAAITD